MSKPDLDEKERDALLIAVTSRYKEDETQSSRSPSSSTTVAENARQQPRRGQVRDLPNIADSDAPAAGVLEGKARADPAAPQSGVLDHTLDHVAFAGQYGAELFLRLMRCSNLYSKAFYTVASGLMDIYTTAVGENQENVNAYYDTYEAVDKIMLKQNALISGKNNNDLKDYIEDELKKEINQQASAGVSSGGKRRTRRNSRVGKGRTLKAGTIQDAFDYKENITIQKYESDKSVGLSIKDASETENNTLHIILMKPEDYSFNRGKEQNSHEIGETRLYIVTNCDNDTLDGTNSENFVVKKLMEFNNNTNNNLKTNLIKAVETIVKNETVEKYYFVRYNKNSNTDDPVININNKSTTFLNVNVEEVVSNNLKADSPEYTPSNHEYSNIIEGFPFYNEKNPVKTHKILQNVINIDNLRVDYNNDSNQLNEMIEKLNGYAEKMAGLNETPKFSIYKRISAEIGEKTPIYAYLIGYTMDQTEIFGTKNEAILIGYYYVGLMKMYENDNDNDGNHKFNLIKKTLEDHIKNVEVDFKQKFLAYCNNNGKNVKGVQPVASAQPNVQVVQPASAQSNRFKIIIENWTKFRNYAKRLKLKIEENFNANCFTETANTTFQVASRLAQSAGGRTLKRDRMVRRLFGRTLRRRIG